MTLLLTLKTREKLRATKITEKHNKKIFMLLINIKISHAKNNHMYIQSWN